MEHTKGKLRVEQNSDDETESMFSIITDEVEPWYVSGTISNLAANIQEANARRLVACWNAAEGIPTETLENGHAVFGKLAETAADRDRLQAMNAELVAALRSVIHDIERNYGYIPEGEEGSVFAGVKEARAALAKAKETQS